MTFPLPLGFVGMSEEVSFEVAGVLCNNIQFMTIYRSPRGDFNVYLGRLAHMLETLDLRKSTVVTGDFNVHFHVDGGEAESLCNLFLSYRLVRSVTGSTGGGSCLDNVFTNQGQLSFCEMEIVEPGLSDHRAISFLCNFSGVELYNDERPVTLGKP